MSSKKDSGNLSMMPPPKHIAIIMDGNGRWAKSRRLPRSSGHQKGVQTVRKIVKHCAKLGVNTLTLFAFSSENMKRSRDEIGLLFKLFLSVLKTETGKLKDNNIRLKIIGDLSVFTPEIIALAQEAEASLQSNTGLTLVIAANYGWPMGYHRVSQKDCYRRFQWGFGTQTISMQLCLINTPPSQACQK